MGLIIITTGEYSDYRVDDLIDGEGDIDALFDQFREFYMPGIKKYFQDNGNRHYIQGWYEMRQLAMSKMVNDGLTTSVSYEPLSEAFINWLIKNHGFKHLSFDIRSCDWDDSFETLEND